MSCRVSHVASGWPTFSPPFEGLTRRLAPLFGFVGGFLGNLGTQLVTKGIATRSKKLLVAAGITTSNKKLLGTRASLLYSNKGHYY